ncbi:Ctr copper transporter [Serendipita vermifera]|nr:Ctr copper transporter [Serendipita vermifera]
MLWNWYTVDACFISSDWHVRSKVAFAFTVICIFILVALVEGVRRFGREYDRRLVRLAKASFTKMDDSSSSSVVAFVPTWSQQSIRAAIFGVQFGAAYILMLLAMYYNGFVIFAIILGGTFGHFVFGRDTVAHDLSNENKGASCC